VMLLSATHRSADLEDLLFGSVLTVDGSDLALGLAVTLGALITGVTLAGRVVIAGFDRDFAAASGIRTGALDTIVLVMLAAALTVALRGVGTLLVLSLLVAPAATARAVARHALVAVWLAPLLGIAFGVIGLVVAHYAAVEPGPVIALVGIAGYCAALGRSELEARAPGSAGS
jgi:ABC-type Mn2+/Zn2+ transport system permease subunit